jgi:hypothetical protein
MSKNQFIKVIGFCVAFICLGAAGCEVWATQVLDLDGDTLVDLWVRYTTGYPGHFVEIEVWMANLVPIHSFKIEFRLGGWDLVNFHTEDIYVDSIWAPIDTCPEPDTVCTVDTCECDTLPSSPDTCACFEWRFFPVRDCYIDTAGCLTSGFKTVVCRGDTADTSSDSCKSATVYANAGQWPDGGFKCIDVDPSYRCLFKFGVDLFCMCDAVPDTERFVYFLVSQGFSSFSDTFGNAVLFRYYPPGKLFAWLSVPGDASNDSTVNMADIIYSVNYLFGGGDPPCIWEAADPDSSCDGNIGDIIYMVNYLFLSGPRLKRGCFCPDSLQIKRINTDVELYENLNLKPLLERR